MITIHFSGIAHVFVNCLLILLLSTVSAAFFLFPFQDSPTSTGQKVTFCIIEVIIVFVVCGHSYFNFVW